MCFLLLYFAAAAHRLIHRCSMQRSRCRSARGRPTAEVQRSIYRSCFEFWQFASPSDILSFCYARSTHRGSAAVDLYRSSFEFGNLHHHLIYHHFATIVYHYGSCCCFLEFVFMRAPSCSVIFYVCFCHVSIFLSCSFYFSLWFSVSFDFCLSLSQSPSFSLLCSPWGRLVYMNL